MLDGEQGMERSALAGHRSLRTGRTLEANMVISVEPGIYFNNFSLDAALANPEQVRISTIPFPAFVYTHSAGM